ncbi:carbon-nitrogen hydrolase family protein [Klenkia taihuensis]|uniref:Predicted amidohydrolase n=1 Tax=Klenkia taihuensis TaxID=1225127 RepID=A0A1I1R8Y3_9ACTN|nr:carbon-nitrogen hydrolase family protein [Klenkia taihuensis]GHE07126.1 apolipoprotein N-acyltransferase [Klenkia taihuensis]SFD30769.1 Predicted amidohydrolase [Klenkia taihuensis]
MTTFAAVAAPFGRDLDAAFARIEGLVADARARGVQLLALPEATLGGYLASLGDSGVTEVLPEHALPPALDVDGPEVARLARIAGDMVVTAGLCESDGADRYNTAVAVTGDGVLGVHRKVHQPLGESNVYAAGDGFAAFETPVGRIGMVICYDKAFPEAARTLAVDGAEVVVCMSAWPGSRTGAAADLAEDRWTHRFDLFDRARALENQIVWVSANQSGTFGSLRFVCSAKVVGPGGDVLATTGTAPGTAVASVDVGAVLAGARRSMGHLRDRRPDTYGLAVPA